MKTRWAAIAGLGLVAATALWVPTEAAPRCRNTGSFDVWLAAFKKEAAAQGVSQRAISAALDGVTFDPGTPGRNSGRAFSQQSLFRFPSRMTASGRYQTGLVKLKQNAAL